MTPRTPTADVAVVKTRGLAKRYGAQWALQDCTVEVPRGRVSALVGPNGAGKTTLLRLLVGLASPTEGTAFVEGLAPIPDEKFLNAIGYLAQDVPLYKQLTAGHHLEMGAHLNRRWDAAWARERLRALGVPLDRPLRTLSGGQRAQVGLAMVLAKRPAVLLLDEPVAALDPLARREFLASLTTAMADGGLTVLMSSHLVHDLERVCDHVILLAAGRTQLCADIEDVVGEHRMLIGPRRPLSEVEPGVEVVQATQATNQTRLLVRCRGPVLDPTWQQVELGLEDIVLAYMGRDGAEPNGLTLLPAGCQPSARE
jgi:ABC-2 type transport system ATP-binding protein